MDDVRLGHNTNQHMREPGPEADSVGDIWTHPWELQFTLVSLRARGGVRPWNPLIFMSVGVGNSPGKSRLQHP